MTCERCDEGLSYGGGTVACFKRSLVPVGVVACTDILAWPASQRKGRLTVPGLVSWECHVERDLAFVDPDQEVSVDVNQAILRNGGCYLVAEALADLFALGAVHAVHELRLRMREAFGEHLREEEVLDRARTAAFSEQAIDGAVGRAAVGQRPHGLDEVDQ